jgi:hypothetical protein
LAIFNYDYDNIFLYKIQVDLILSLDYNEDMDFIGFFNGIFNMGGYEQIAGLGLVVLFVILVVLRIMLTMSYSGAVALMNLSAKPVKVREDILKLGHGAFGRSAKEYLALAEKGAKVDAVSLAENSIFKNRLLFFNFNSMKGLVLGLEKAFVPLAILITIGAENKMELAMVAGIAFLLICIFAAIFDIETAKEKYVTNLAGLLIKEVGKFFPSDTGAAIYNFNAELIAAIKSNIYAMTTSVEATLKAISRQEGLDDAAVAWKHSLEKATLLQETISKTVAAENKAMAAASDAMVQSLNAAKENQAALSRTMEQYETALKDTTSQMGDALGKIINYHLAGANDQIAKSINEDLRLTRAANIEYIAEIKGVFAELAEQSRCQTRILMDLLVGMPDTETNAGAHNVRQQAGGDLQKGGGNE